MSDCINPSNSSNSLNKWTSVFLCLSFIGLLTTIIQCKSVASDPEPGKEAFDRTAMLSDWADKLIIPSYEQFVAKALALKNATKSFTDDPTLITYQGLVEVWEDAYLNWQSVSQFDIGRAQEVRLRDNVNLYPTDTAGIHENAMADSNNLQLPSENVKQGFPAMDFLLFGIAPDQDAILAFYRENVENASYRAYLYQMSSRIHRLSVEVLEDWNTRYRDLFIEAAGNNANASVDKMVNDYIFYIEKVVRAGKIGIPAGIFSVNVLPDRIEAYYHRRLSKRLLIKSIRNAQNFFNGMDPSSSKTSLSLHDYLKHVQDASGDELAVKINSQFDNAMQAAIDLDDNFIMQLDNDPGAMRKVYDELQKNVVLLKVDLLQALNIQVDYVDADGD